MRSDAAITTSSFLYQLWLFSTGAKGRCFIALYLITVDRNEEQPLGKAVPLIVIAVDDGFDVENDEAFLWHMVSVPLLPTS